MSGGRTDDGPDEDDTHEERGSTMNSAGTAGRPWGTGLVVAVDGPSGSGKSTISRRVAGELGLGYLDTGAMYRAAAWWCRHEGIDLDDAPAVARATAAMPLDIVTDPAAPTVRVAGTEVEPEIRSAAISAIVSKVATNLDVRANMKERQRAIMEAASRAAGMVAEGRDITTVVAPDADVRVLLVASEDARLARRATEMHGTADAAALAATRDLVVRRDADDATVSQFFEAADGVTTVDSSDLSFDQTYEAVLDVVRRAAERSDHE